MSDDDMREIEEKLEILRQRAKAWKDFVSPRGQPPLLWQMVMLAEAGFTILPPVRDPDPDRSFPEMTVEMRPLDWGPDHQCLVGGSEFSVMAVPPSYHGHLIRPKPSKVPTFYALAAAEIPSSMGYDVEHFRRHDMAIGYHGEVRWRSRIMTCAGSRSDRCALGHFQVPAGGSDD